MGRQIDLDLPQLDPIAAYLDLEIDAAKVLDQSAGRNAAAIPRPVQPPEFGMVHEALRRQVGASVVTFCESRASNPDFSRHRCRKRLAVAVHYINRGVVDRLANRDLGFRRGDLRATRPDRRLRRAVHVPERLDSLQKRIGQIGRQSLAPAQRNEVLASTPAMAYQQSPRRGGGLHDGDVVSDQQAGKFAGIHGFITGGDHHTPALRQGEEEFKNGNIK